MKSWILRGVTLSALVLVIELITNSAKGIQSLIIALIIGFVFSLLAEFISKKIKKK